MVGSIDIAERAQGDAGFDEIVKRKAGGRRAEAERCTGTLRRPAG
jgi:hypothetical protein